MNFPQHAKAGFYTSCLAASAGYLFKDLRIALLAGLLCFVGSVIPDLDTDSIPSRWAARFGLVLSCCCMYLANKYPVNAADYYFHANVAGFLFFAVKSGTHRGTWFPRRKGDKFSLLPTHKYIWFVFLLTLGVYHQNFLYAAFGVGLLCHVLVDSLSPLDSKELGLSASSSIIRVTSVNAAVASIAQHIHSPGKR